MRNPVFSSALEWFTFLIGIDEENMLKEMQNTSSENQHLILETEKLIQAHFQNKNATEFNQLIAINKENLVENENVLNLIGKQIGVYQLVEVLGKGGMGVVYLGRRNDGLLVQDVAIKFVYPSIINIYGEEQILKEAQHLASLEHPNIAKVITVEKTKNEHSCIIMEYVKGIPIDQYCDQYKLSSTKRLALFQLVCKVISYAHQQFVIHADIKPSNILVDEFGQPKIMDFGVAVKSDVQTETLNLQAVSAVYSSPEQHTKKRLTPECDIFSLGKLLEHLIPNPSKILASIISKATKTNPVDRISSSEEFNFLLELYISQRPVPTYSNSWLYRFQKFSQRNNKAIVFSFFAIVIVLSAVIFGIQKHIDSSLAKQNSHQITDFVLDIFSSTEREENGVTTIYSMLLSASENLTVNKKIFFIDKIKFFVGISKAIKGEENYELSLELVQKAIDLYLNSNQPRDNEYYVALVTKGIILDRLNRSNEALVTYKEIESGGPSVFDDRLISWAALLSNMGNTYTRLNMHDKSAEYLIKAIDIDIKTFGEVHNKIAIRYNNIASTYMFLNEFENALSFAKKSYNIRSQLYPAMHPKLAISLRTLGKIYRQMGNTEKSLAAFTEALIINSKHYPSNHSKVISTNVMIAGVLIDAGENIKASNLIHKAFEDVDINNKSNDKLIALMKTYREQLKQKI